MLEGYKTLTFALAVLAGAFVLIMTGKQDHLPVYSEIVMYLCGLLGIREAGDKGLLKGIVNINRPSQPAGVDTVPGGA